MFPKIPVARVINGSIVIFMNLVKSILDTDNITMINSNPILLVRESTNIVF